MLSTLIAAVTLGGAVASPVPMVESQIGPRTYPTVQSEMAKSEVVFVGHIERLERVVTLPEHGMRDRVRRPHGFARYTVTVKVGEVFKGEPGETIVFRHEVTGDNRNYDAWQQDRTNFFFTRSPYRGYLDGWKYMRIGEPAIDEDPERTHSLPMFSMDFKILRTEGEFLEAARKFKQRAQRNPPVERFWLPYGMAEQIAPPGDGAIIELPVVPEMLPIATALFEKPESFWAKPVGEEDLRWQREIASIRRIGREMLELLQ